MEIAVYGKGGIGKSTLSANISAAMSLAGKRVLQIGCDPKHDSTKLLLNGKKITTVLDYIKKTGVSDYKLADVLFTGFNGIGCIEAGGPEPGVGCAGRGIITAFEMLEKFNIKKDYDVVLYDVLGDVVCGGFAVPIRREYSDVIFIVTSGEYMSLYAANNILRGIKNYDENKCRVAGILYNSRNVKNEDLRVEAFANAVNLKIFSKIPRSDVFAQAERQNITAVEMQEKENGEIFSIFGDIAMRILSGPELYAAKPITDEELETLLMGEQKNKFQNSISSEHKKPKIDVDFGQNSTKKSEATDDDYDMGYLSKNVLRDEPLHGCAFNGAMCMSSQINDAAVVAHSPKSCLYLSYQSISSAGRRGLFERGAIMPHSLSPNLIATDMDESDMIFGATAKLTDLVQRVQESVPKPRGVVVVTSCPAGIIGDDTEKVLDLSVPDCPVVLLKTDGNLTGDFLQGMLMAYTQLAKQIIKPNVPKQANLVNIVFEKAVAKNTNSNFRLISKFLEAMDVKVNCRFLYNTGFESIENFCSASLNLLAYKDYTGNILKEFFESEYDCEFFDRQFPTGFLETCDWLREIGKYFGKEEVAERIIEENAKNYLDRVEKIKPYLRGKKIFIVTYNHELDWILKTALDLEMEISKIAIVNFSQDEGFRSRLPESAKMRIEQNYEHQNMSKDIEELRPDILLSNYESSLPNATCFVDTIPMCPDNGFFSGLVMAERWQKLLDFNLEGEWKNDKKLFDKYYA